MLTKIHSSHLGVVRCKQRARDILFWPGMGKDIEDLISQCDICAEHHMSNPREPMTVGEILSRPWEFVSTNLFTFHGDDYLLIVDSCSCFIEITKLTNTSSNTVIQHTKSIFARHGIPATLRVIMVLNTLLMSLKHSATNGVLNTLPQAHIIPRQMGWRKNLYKSSSVYWTKHKAMGKIHTSALWNFATQQ